MKKVLKFPISDSTYAALSLYAPIDANGTARTSGPLMGITWWCAFDWYTHQQTTGYQSMGLMKMDRVTPNPVLAKLSAAYKKLAPKSENITDVAPAPGAAVIGKFSLDQNYPNPFNPSTVIRYNVPEAGVVTLTVCDVLGRDVETIVSEHKQAGSYSAEWRSAGKASGIYSYRLRSGTSVDTKKMAVIK